MVPLSTRNTKQRDTLAMPTSTGTAMIPGMLSTIIMPLLISRIGVGVGAQSSWIIIMGILSILAIPATLIEYYFTIERVTAESDHSSQETVSFGKQIAACFQDKYWVMIVLFTMILHLCNNLSSSSMFYYCNWVLGNSVESGATKQILVNMIAQAPMGFGVVILWPLVRKFGKRISVAPDTTVLQAARELGIELSARCGGNGTCGKCRVKVNGNEVLACQTKVDADMTVELPRKADAKILTSGQAVDLPVDPVQPGYLLAFDIGTTTVVCFLLSPEGQELTVESMLNSQASYGADVISRIQCALAGEMDALTKTIRAGMSDLIAKCCEKAGIDSAQIGVISVVGNPCMQQLFLGITPANLAAVSFAPVLKSAKAENAAAIFPECPDAVLLTIPDISGYVGADTIGCVLASKMYEAEETTLMVDIGTNGEMVLAYGERMVACSTAAGPALEGANITFGMRGSTGAIDHVWTENGKLRYSVIGDCEPTGICGSGIMDAIAALLELKILNKRGRIQSSEELDGQRIIRLSENIYLTQEDIRQVQMAKGAIAAGIHLMCTYLGITPAEIQKVILAGAFGSFLNPESACRMELLPKELAGKITAAGNLAGVGAKMTAIGKEQFAFTEGLVKQIEFIELADMPAFQKTFAKCMTLP